MTDVKLNRLYRLRHREKRLGLGLERKGLVYTPDWNCVELWIKPRYVLVWYR